MKLKCNKLVIILKKALTYMRGRVIIRAKILNGNGS